MAGFKEGSSEFKRLALLVTPPAPGSAPSKPVPLGTLTAAAPPNLSKSKPVVTPSFKATKSLQRTYREHLNKELGRAGELLVLRHEIQALRAAKRADLASQVIHVSEVMGDGAGYDIKSFEPDGTIKYIEVKTTRGSSSTAFFITYVELEFSRKEGSKYSLYRLFSFDSQHNTANFFVLRGFAGSNLHLLPTVYRASRV